MRARTILIAMALPILPGYASRDKAAACLQALS